MLLDAICKDNTITQRELSRKTGLSLGSVNILLNKMLHDGLVKINQIPMNRAIYMLTPKGFIEKINKTVYYIKYHYNYINEMKIKISNNLHTLQQIYPILYIYLEYDEISEVVRQAASLCKNIIMVDDDINLTESYPIIVTNHNRVDCLKEKHKTIINIIEML